ncbi:MAG: acetyl-CoA synthase subunit gamma [Phycisphaerae bacterium]|nr:acetyl-CoA synthase subunit gamma [Phycisphaerae bacterium]
MVDNDSGDNSKEGIGESRPCCGCLAEPTVVDISTELTFFDHLGSFKARWGIGRMSYIVRPGLYRVGTPDDNSPVLVSANYKMSFDRLRSQLNGRNAWILVLDTRGINVWCAAGKGTFGTEEIIQRVQAVQLDEVVNHKTLIVPQLGAPGVGAHKVREGCGFRVVFGPVRAEDLPAFLDNHQQATAAMRRVQFTMWDRLVLVPMEWVVWGKYAIFMAIALFLLGGLNREGYSSSLTLSTGLASAILLLGAYGVTGLLGPILLPWLPGKAFSVKGLWVGLVMAMGGLLYWQSGGRVENNLTQAAWVLIIPAMSSFMLMNFTGASTYTSLSGVKREMKFAVPLQIIAAAGGIGLWLAGRFL